ncbi:hypothetical protein M8C21_029749, partial [Ambrosia artemisiifolia]
MLGDGKPINLLRLYLCVREKGGYESVSRNGSWDLVAKEIGCDSKCSASLKVVYVKYLDVLDEWFCKTVKDKDLGKENEASRKRKRERYLPMLDWIKRVSKDPCDLAIGSLPERSKWKIYGGEHVWKQVLSAREARLLPTNVDPLAKLKW